ncbi:MAG: hypothetical protein PWP65_1865 [Clostridia bacterium]|nr:hypothetical protein [Clostridia bacterium]
MNSVKIISTNETAVRKAVENYAACLKARPEVMAVYLCGSRARGTYSPYSDVDLLILIKNDKRRPHDRVPDYLPDHFPLSLDLFVYTPEELRSSTFAQKLLEHAIEL